MFKTINLLILFYGTICFIAWFTSRQDDHVRKIKSQPIYLSHKVLNEVTERANPRTTKSRNEAYESIRRNDEMRSNEAMRSYGASLKGEILESAVCKKIEGLRPVESASTFSNSVGSVSYMTRIKNSKNQKILHLWYYKDRLVSKIKLSVRSNNYRTYSTQTIPQNHTGAWKVAVQDESGKLLQTDMFEIMH